MVTLTTRKLYLDKNIAYDCYLTSRSLEKQLIKCVRGVSKAPQIWFDFLDCCVWTVDSSPWLSCWRLILNDHYRVSGRDGECVWVCECMCVCERVWACIRERRGSFLAWSLLFPSLQLLSPSCSGKQTSSYEILFH